MKNIRNKLTRHMFAGHLLLVALVSCLIIYVTLKWLDVYTLHNEAVIVPDVRGLQIEEASRHLSANGLRYNVIDSVFSRNVRPGAIVELLPAVGSKVKEGRIIFITVNAISSQMAAIPGVMDLSFRQAYALLKARGFESVEIEYISGEYKDLAVGVELRGRFLEEGEMVQLTAPLVLKVSNGQMEEMDVESSHPGLNGDAETWF
ncbi:MAG: PASTA domain-containing protein [Tannerellaceae bacterium]|nr:PASTA domain-containing protein [Tannerellaceae bacterium]